MKGLMRRSKKQAFDLHQNLLQFPEAPLLQLQLQKPLKLRMLSYLQQFLFLLLELC
jgi:hypothetical protein